MCVCACMWPLHFMCCMFQAICVHVSYSRVRMGGKLHKTVHTSVQENLLNMSTTRLPPVAPQFHFPQMTSRVCPDRWSHTILDHESRPTQTHTSDGDTVTLYVTLHTLHVTLHTLHVTLHTLHTQTQAVATEAELTVEVHRGDVKP